jgi:hypothetical protein
MVIDSTDKSMLLIFLETSDRKVMDIISHATIQSGVEIPNITNSFLMASGDDYFSSMNAFANNFYAICSLSRSRIFYIDVQHLATKFAMKRWITPAIHSMFKTIGVSVMSTYGEKCDGTINVNNMGKFQTNNLNIAINSTFGTDETIDPMMNTSNENDRNRIGKALRSALYSLFTKINTYGATMSDIHTAIHNRNEIALYGMGLEMPLSPYDNWEFTKYDYLEYKEWLEDIHSVNNDVVIMENVIETDIPSIVGRRVLCISNSKKFYYPSGLSLYMEPYGTRILMFGYVASGGIETSIPSNVIKAWMNRPIGIHNTQARHVVELMIHRVSTQSMCVQLTGMSEVPVASLITSADSAYALDDRYIVLHKEKKKHVYFDGDTLVTWPTASRFWETGDYTPFANRDDMEKLHKKELMAYSTEGIVLFNFGPAYEDADGYVLIVISTLL